MRQRDGGLLARCGAGVMIGPEDVTSGAVRDSVRLALEDPSYRDTGRCLAAEIAALPEPAIVARTLLDRISAR